MISIKSIVQQYFDIGRRMKWNLPPIQIKFAKCVKVGHDYCVASATITWKDKKNQRALITFDERIRFSDHLIYMVLLHEICHIAVRDCRNMGHGKAWYNNMRAIVNKNLYEF